MLEWVPRADQLGEHHVKLAVSDGRTKSAVDLMLIVRPPEVVMPTIPVFRGDGLWVSTISKGFTGSVSLWLEWDSYARIYVNASELLAVRGGGSGGRGINVRVIDKATGREEGGGSFDTWLDNRSVWSHDTTTWFVSNVIATDELVNFLSSIGPGRIIVMAAADAVFNPGFAANERFFRYMEESMGSRSIRKVEQLSWSMVYGTDHGVVGEVIGYGEKTLESEIPTRFSVSSDISGGLDIALGTQP